MAERVLCEWRADVDDQRRIVLEGGHNVLEQIRRSEDSEWTTIGGMWLCEAAAFDFLRNLASELTPDERARLVKELSDG